MRHLKHRFQLGRKKEHRVALMSNLGAALLRHGKIQTTLPKAKALRPFVEKVITLAVKASKATPEQALHYRRQAISKVRDKDAVAILFNERAEMFTERPGGYTRIYKLGNRLGDAAEMAVIQLIPAEDEGYEKRRSAKPVKATEEAPVAEVASEESSASEDVTAEDSEEASEEEAFEATDEVSEDSAEVESDVATEEPTEEKKD